MATPSMQGVPVCVADAIEAGELRIQEHTLAAQDEDGAADVMNRHKS